MRQVQGRPLWVGHAGDTRDCRPLFDAGIRAVVELADGEPLATLARNFIRCRFPLADGGGNLPWLMALAVESIAALLRAGVPTLVACGCGLSRSVCVAAGGLALAEGRTLKDALTIIAKSGPADVSPGLLADVQTALGGEPELAP